MAIEFLSCPACGGKNAPHRTTCLSCGSPLTNPAPPILHRWPLQKAVVVVAALLLALAVPYRLMAFTPGRDRNVKTEMGESKEPKQTHIGSEGKGIERDLPQSGPPAVANMPTPSYPAEAENSRPPTIGPAPASSKSVRCEFVVNPKTGHITTARRVVGQSGYVPVKLKPGSVSGSYIDPVTGRQTFVGLTTAPDPFVAMVRAYQVALCDRHERGEISVAELDDLLNKMIARADEARQKYAEELRRLVIEQQKLALERERLRQAQEMQRQALEAQWRTAQETQQFQQQALEIQRRALEAQQRLAAQQAQQNLIIQEALREISGPKQLSANCQVFAYGNQWQVNCY